MRPILALLLSLASAAVGAAGPVSLSVRTW
jgi:hypothetical protein